MKKLLIVIDYQKDFVNGSLGFDDARTIDDYIASLIRTYHENNDDVIFTFDTHQENYLETREGKNLPVVHCLKNSDGWQLYGKVALELQETDQCFNKKTFGSLDLGNYLRNKIYQSITFVGVVSDICVISNAIICKAALPETDIYIDTHGVASNNQEMQKKALDILENLQFHIV